MKILALLSILILILFYSNLARAADDGGSLPYDTFNQAVASLASKKVEGVECVPLFLKSNQEGNVIDPTKARFRVQAKDGGDQLLKIEALTDVPKNELTDFESGLVKKGFSHRVWIPKNKEGFFGGHIMHSLPKGTIDFAQGWIPKLTP